MLRKWAKSRQAGYEIVLLDEPVRQDYLVRKSMLGIQNMREQCFLTANVQNIKRLIKAA